MLTEILKDGVQEERQISIDLISMKEIIKYPSSGLPNPQTTKKPVHSMPKKNKLLGTSLPNSACSSPHGVQPSTKSKDHDQDLERASTKATSLSH